MKAVADALQRVGVKVNAQEPAAGGGGLQDGRGVSPLTHGAVYVDASWLHRQVLYRFSKKHRQVVKPLLHYPAPVPSAKVGRLLLKATVKNLLHFCIQSLAWSYAPVGFAPKLGGDLGGQWPRSREGRARSPKGRNR